MDSIIGVTDRACRLDSIFGADWWQEEIPRKQQKGAAPCWADKLPTSSPSVVPTPVGSSMWFHVMKVVSTLRDDVGRGYHSLSFVVDKCISKKQNPSRIEQKSAKITPKPALSDLIFFTDFQIFWKTLFWSRFVFQPHAAFLAIGYRQAIHEQILLGKPQAH